MPKKELKVVTSGADWRKARQAGEVVELPSGNVARLRTLSLLSLMERGKIPDPLSGLINQMIGGKVKQAADLETFQDFVELLKLISAEAFMEPRVVEEPQAEDEISIEDIDFNDKLYVFNWSQKEIKLMGPFRGESLGDVEAVDSSDELQPEAQPDNGDSG